MVTNLPAEAKAKWIKVMEAKTPEEKIKALEEFLAAVPKHKGTEKLIRQVRKRIAELRREIELRESVRRAAAARRKMFIEKDGDVQLAVIGQPNSGKTSFVNALTGASYEVSNVPFTTDELQPAMLIWNNVYIQLIDTPPIIPGTAQGRGAGPILISTVRNADGVVIVIDLTRDPVKQVRGIISELREARILVEKPKALVRIERTTFGGIQVIGELVGCTVEDVKKLLNEYRIYNARVKIYGKATLEDVESAIFEETTYKPAIFVGMKADAAPKDRIEAFIEEVKSKYPYFIVSSNSVSEEFKGRFAETVLKTLDLIRVYTKSPYKEKPADKPLVVKKGTTVAEIARMIHSSLYENFKYAKVIRFVNGVKKQFRVGKSFVPEDGDIIEIHA